MHPVLAQADVILAYNRIIVNTVLGTGRASSTDSIGTLGEINSPYAAVFDRTENYVYLTDMSGGGLIRKLAVTSQFDQPFDQKYSVKTIFTGNSRNIYFVSN